MLLAATSDVSGEIDLTDVVAVASSAMQACRQSFTLVNTDTLWDIGEYAFAYSGLTGTVTLPDVYVVGNNAFYGCKALITADLTHTPHLEQISGFAFAQSGLEKILFPDDSSYSVSLGESAFYRSQLTVLTVPTYVSAIGEDLVSGCPLDGNFITMTSETAPRLTYMSTSMQFEFCRLLDDRGDATGEENADFRVVLAGAAEGQEEAYAAAWREAMAPPHDWFEDPNLVAGENFARRMLGLELLPVDPDDTQAPSKDPFDEDLTPIPGSDLEPDPDLNGDNGSTGDTNDVELIPNDSEDKQLPDDEDLEPIPDPDEGDSTPDPDPNEPDDSTQSGGEDAPEEGETV